jgi:cysteinyl-tRNA synthetase
MTGADATDALKAGIEALIAMRAEMLKAGNKAEADRLRDQLASQGIQLKDSKDSATGERVTTWEVKR